MKKLVFIGLFSLSLFGFESRGNISVEYNKFYSPSSSSKAIRGDFELKQDGFLFHINETSHVFQHLNQIVIDLLN